MEKILIVEDEILIMKELLKLCDWAEYGLEPVTAPNGLAGVQKFVEERPGIVITDIRMPHMDGIEMMEQIRGMDPSVKFIVLSAYGDFEYVRDALKLKAEDYILKKDLNKQILSDVLAAVKTTSLNTSLPYADQSDQPSFSAVITRAVTYIQENYQNPSLRIGGVALACDLSASRLSTLFREEMGSTVNDYITSVRMEQAKYLLSSRKYKVYEVADMVGYRSSAYFCTVFQQHTGVKPNKYQG